MPGAAAVLTTVFGIPTLRPAMPVPGTLKLWMLSSGGVIGHDSGRGRVVRLHRLDDRVARIGGDADRYCPAATPGGTPTVELVASVPFGSQHDRGARGPDRNVGARRDRHQDEADVERRESPSRVFLSV